MAELTISPDETVELSSRTSQRSRPRTPAKKLVESSRWATVLPALKDCTRQ